MRAEIFARLDAHLAKSKVEVRLTRPETPQSDRSSKIARFGPVACRALRRRLMPPPPNPVSSRRPGLARVLRALRARPRVRRVRHRRVPVGPAPTTRCAVCWRRNCRRDGWSRRRARRRRPARAGTSRSTPRRRPRRSGPRERWRTRRGQFRDFREFGDDASPPLAGSRRFAPDVGRASARPARGMYALELFERDQPTTVPLGGSARPRGPRPLVRVRGAGDGGGRVAVRGTRPADATGVGVHLDVAQPRRQPRAAAAVLGGWRIPKARKLESSRGAARITLVASMPPPGRRRRR